jgi:hypothetical protein
MFWLSLISSIAGIISFVISLFDRFKQWRRYLQYIACAAIGLTTGVMLSMSEKTVQQFTQSQLIYLIAFAFTMSLFILFVYRYLNHSNDPFLMTILLIVGMAYFSVRLLNSVEASQSFFKTGDYLILSDYHLKQGNHTRAAEFLKKYREIQTVNLPDRILDSIDKRVDILYYKGIEDIK